MIIAATVVIKISYSHTKDLVQSFQEESINNSLHSLELSVIDNYDYFLSSKYKYVDSLKKRLKASVVRSKHIYDSMSKDVQGMFYACTHNQDGTVPTAVCGQRLIDNDLWANNVPVQWINSISNFHSTPSRSESIELMVIDNVGNIILSTDKSFQSTFIDKKRFNNYYGDLLSRSGQFIIFDNFSSEMIGENNHIWKLGYFTPYENFTIAAFINIDSFMKKGKKEKLKEIRSSVRKILLGIKVLGAGSAFVVDNEGNILGLEDIPEKDDLLQSVIASSKKSADTVKTTISLTLPASGVKQNCFIYTKYFDGFDWYLSVAIPEDAITKKAKDLAITQVKFMLPIFIICILLAVWWIYTVTNPLKVLAKKLKKVPGHDFTSSDHSKLLDGLPLSSRNEIGNLAQTFAFMTDKLSVSIKQLVETTAANERIECELNVAREIQLGTLPTDFSFEPERKALDIHAYLIPAKEIGGDLYDFFFIDDDHLCFTVGDVAGKGVPAALFMVIAKKLINNNAHHARGEDISPAKIMEQVNEIIYQDNTTSTFVTLFIGILNVTTGELRYANGGHVPPIFIDCSSDPYYRKDLSGPVVGVIPGIQYKEILTALSPGGAVFLCTDGVTEAMNETDELFGEPRLLDDFAGLKDKSCKDAVESILHKVRIHAGTAPQSDDIAMLMVRWGVNEEERENVEQSI